MFSRRGFLSAILGSTAVAGTPSADGPLTPAALPLQLLSPKDAFVLSMAVASGSTVKVGDTICQLDTNNEDRAMEQIALAQALLVLEDISLDEGAMVTVPPGPIDVRKGNEIGLPAGNDYNFPSDHPLGLRMRVLDIAKKTAQIYVDFAKDKQAAAQVQAQDGGAGAIAALGNPIEIAELKAQETQNAAAVATATAELLKANIASARFLLSVAQLQKKQDLVKAHLAREHDRVAAEKARLTITAPVAGKITLTTANGCFVKLGHVIAEITL